MPLYEVYLDIRNGTKPKLLATVNEDNKEKAKDKVQKQEFESRGYYRDMKKFMKVYAV
jgi:hypothetical protein